MDAAHIAKGKVTITFSPEELAFLSNTINETLEGVEEREFQTRTGETRSRASEMLAQLHKFLHEAQQASD
jgi:hypothetical protein